MPRNWKRKRFQEMAKLAHKARFAKKNACDICNNLESRPWQCTTGAGDFESDGKPEIEGDLNANSGMKVDEVEDEIPMPVKELINQKNRCRILDSSNATQRPQLKPTVCFVCMRQLTCMHREFAFSKIPSRNDHDYLFLFSEILKIPEKKAVKYLDNFGQPEEWMDLCEPCQDLLLDARRIRAEISELEARLQNCQKDVLIKMKGNLDERSKFTFPQGSDQKDKCVTMIAIWEHVRNSNYDVLDNLIKETFNEDITTKVETEMTPPSYEPCDNEEPCSSGSTMIHLPYSEMTDERSFVDEDNELSTLSENKCEDGKKVYFCGLCDDQQTFSGKGLISHTKKFHQLPSTSSSHSQKTKGPLTSLEPTSFRYACPNCPDVRVYSVGRYAHHLLTHQRRPYRCSICLELFPDDEDLKTQHWDEKHANVEDHSGERFIKLNFNPGDIWKCMGCHSGFLNEAERNAHEKKCSLCRSRSIPNSTRQKCKVCSKTFRHIEEWRLHRVLEHPEVDSMSCFYCDESFAEKTVEGVEIRHDTKLVEHIKNVHNIPRLCDEFFGCEICGFVPSSGKTKGKSEHLLQKHGIPLQKAYTCPICSKHYTDWQTIMSHISFIHFRSGVSICDICGHECKRPKYLTHHKLMEHGIEPEEGVKVHNCPKEGCDYKSTRKQRMDKHYEDEHEAEIPKPHKCPHCPKAFRFSNKLKNHLEIHLNKGSKPYQCEICGNSFAVKNYLYIHKRLSHEGRTFPSTNKKKPPRKVPKKKQNATAINDDNSQQQDDSTIEQTTMPVE